MKISEAVESSIGVVNFVGELEGAELDMVLQLGLLTLLERGAIKAQIVPIKGEQH